MSLKTAEKVRQLDLLKLSDAERSDLIKSLKAFLEQRVQEEKLYKSLEEKCPVC